MDTQLNLFEDLESKTSIRSPRKVAKRDRLQLGPTRVGEHLPLEFINLQNRGVLDTPRFGVEYPPPKDPSSFYDKTVKPHFLPLQTSDGNLEDVLLELQSGMAKYLITRVDGKRFAYIGAEPITNLNGIQVGSRLYFNHQTKEEIRFGRREQILSNGLIIVASRLPLDRKAILAELIKNSKDGYHTLFVLHEQTKDGIYTHYANRAYIFGQGKNYFILGRGSVLFYKPYIGDGVLMNVRLVDGKPEINFLKPDLDIQLMAYWSNNQIFREISKGLNGGLHTNGSFVPLEKALDNKPLLLAYFT